MEAIKKTPEELVLVTDMNISLANAIRRSVGEIPILAVDECDIYKNDSVLYDEIISHRVGLIPLKNQKMGPNDVVEMKLKVKCKGEDTEVLSGSLVGDVVYPTMPLVLLGDGQELELVARARVGKGINHAKFMPGLAYYKHLPKIKLSAEGEKQTELVDLYPDVFESFGEKIRVKNAAACDLDQEDAENFPGVEISFDDQLVFTVESWGQVDAPSIFTEACKALKDNLSEVSKAIK
jgi:DNA-directed RNA polymerase subunit D